MGVSERELWCMSWLELDARCRGADRASWKQWEHTRLLVAAWTGGKPGKIIPLPTDRPTSKTPAITPSADWVEQMRQRALNMN